MCAAAKNCKKSAKTPLLGVQGRLKSSMLIGLKSLCLVLVLMSNMSLPICNRFHTRRAKSSKVTSFSGECPSLTLSFEGNLFTQRG